LKKAETDHKIRKLPRKYLNKIKGKWIYNSGKPSKKEETPQNLNLDHFLKI